jgi:UDP-N-acetylmuramoylalanine--D-glutamate ligase
MLATMTQTPVQADPSPRVLVLGMGSTGAACARYFAKQDLAVAFYDTRTAPPALADIQQAMPQAVCYRGPEMPELPRTVERLVVSPGTPLDLPLLVKARSRGLAIESDIDLFMREVRAPVIGITGSNGKSTVTSMLASALGSAGWRVAAGGNLGPPALDLLGSDAEVYALELSSFQLERSRPPELTVAALLNISPDHLDMHGDYPSYVAAKARILSRARRVVINRDDSALAELLPAGVGVTGFTLGQPSTGDFGLRTHNGCEYLACGRALLIRTDELRVAGKHNQSNALAALALGAAIGADLATMLGGLREFRGLAHRMQQVASIAGVSWVNDSKATNVGAAVASIASLDSPLVLIAGGDAKAADLQPLADCLAGRRAEVVLIGRDREQFAAALAGVCPCHRADDMAGAVAKAAAIADPGWTVLLAPAAASLDMFSNFAARGDAFAQAVREIDA